MNFDELIENAVLQSEQMINLSVDHAIKDVDGFFNLNRTMLALSLIFRHLC